MKKRIVLCADDYGQAPAISQGIINLLRLRRLSAVSCMTTTVHWGEHAQWLRPFYGSLDIGLHVNLTEGKALSGKYINTHGEVFRSLPRLLCDAFLRRLDKQAVLAECIAQIDKFAEITGFLPQFLDGHQHVHQFPVIREAIIEAYQQRLKNQNAYVRLVKEPFKFGDIYQAHKKIIIRLSGARALQDLLEKNNIDYNQSFAGIYDFRRARFYPRLFTEFLRSIQDKGLIMCHPGLYDGHGGDPIASARYAEYQYFSGSRFQEDCRQLGIEIKSGIFMS